jgi:hypothetical protein
MFDQLLAQLVPGKRLVVTAEFQDTGTTPGQIPPPQPAPIFPPLGKIAADYQPPDIAVQLFPADYAIYRDISQLPVHALSATWLQSIGPGAPIHPDFGAAAYGAGMPYTIIPPTEARVPVTLRYADESDKGPWPIPPGCIIEAPSDSHCLLLDPASLLLYELYALSVTPKGYAAASGVIWDLAKVPARPAGFTSADAAGLPILPLLVRYDEATSPAGIRHALRFTAKPTQNKWLPPANHQSGQANPNYPPMGCRIRLKATVDLTLVKSAKVRAILQAARTYGLILADNGTSGYVQGTPDQRWNDDEMAELKHYHLADFEVVDTGATLIGE